MSSEGSDEALAAQQQHPLAELPTGETTAEGSPADVRPASPAVEGDNPPASTASGLLGPGQHSSETGVDQVRVRENYGEVGRHELVTSSTLVERGTLRPAPPANPAQRQ
jgi:hypothetical protein